MTDKEKLDAIRAEIHRLIDVRGYDREMANDLFAFMDSLPNESVTSVWHDKDEEPDEDTQVLINLYGYCYVVFYHKEDKRFYMFGKPKHYLCEINGWAYIHDILKSYKGE